MSDWADLDRELDAWAAAGRSATFWWRDDDAAEPCEALDRLFALAAAADAPLGLAVIPARAAPNLAPRIGREGDRIAVLQHGYAHRNHNPEDGGKKAELGPHRPTAVICEELARGRARMDALFGADWLPVLVPPYNRIAPALIPALPALGFRGLSTDKPRPAPRAATGLVQVNCHVDIMHWPDPRGFLGETGCLSLVTAHLRARRDGAADPAEPTGLLTHHLAHDAPAWAFLEALLAHLRRHPAARFLPVDAVFAA